MDDRTERNVFEVIHRVEGGFDDPVVPADFGRSGHNTRVKIDIYNVPMFIFRNTVIYEQQRADLHLDTKFLRQFPPKGFRQGFSVINPATRQHPIRLAVLFMAYEQYRIFLDNYGGYANPREWISHGEISNQDHNGRKSYCISIHSPVL